MVSMTLANVVVEVFMSDSFLAAAARTGTLSGLKSCDLSSFNYSATRAVITSAIPY